MKWCPQENVLLSVCADSQMCTKHHETRKGIESRNGFVEKGADLPSLCPGTVETLVDIISFCKNRDSFCYTYLPNVPQWPNPEEFGREVKADTFHSPLCSYLGFSNHYKSFFGDRMRLGHPLAEIQRGFLIRQTGFHCLQKKSDGRLSASLVHISVIWTTETKSFTWLCKPPCAAGGGFTG